MIRFKMLMVFIIINLIPFSNNGGEVSPSLEFEPITKKENKIKTWEYHKLTNEVADILEDVRWFYGVDSVHLIYMDSIRSVYKLPKDIFYRQIYKESLFIYNIESPVGARGYMQIMPCTYETFKNKLSLQDPTRTDFRENILTGSYYMAFLKRKMDKRYGRIPEKTKWKYALAAYHSGLGGYKRDLKTGKNCKGYVKFILKNRR